MNIVEEKPLISQAEYAKKIRSLLPKEAFKREPNKLVILLINLIILILGWAIAKHLDSWPLYMLPLYLPLAVVMANSISVLGFSAHEVMHGCVIRNSRLMRIVSFMALSMVWMPVTLWKIVHNIEHHNKTNSLLDPDRNYLYEQPQTWGKWIQDQFVPSAEVNPISLTIGMTLSWVFYTFRNLTSVVLFNSKSVDYVPAAFTVSEKDRRAIALEFLLIFMIHLGILWYLEFSPLKLAPWLFSTFRHWLRRSDVLYLHTSYALPHD